MLINPCNKYLVIKPLTDSDKVGSEGILFAPGNAVKQYKLATVEALCSTVDLPGLKVGSTILYDSLGEVSHRVGNQGFSTVKSVNVIAIVSQEENS